MKNNFFCINSSKYLYEKPSHKSKISSEILYGEKFKILSKNKGWLKIKTSFDNYTGYIKNINYLFSALNDHIPPDCCLKSEYPHPPDWFGLFRLPHPPDCPVKKLTL